MTEGYESLGKARLDLEANLTEFDRNMREAHSLAERLQHALERIAAIATGSKHALGEVRMAPGQAAETRVTASAILEGVKHISRESRDAAHELDRVKLHERQAAESEVPARLIGSMLDSISRKAGEARRSLESVRLAGALAHGAGGNRPGYGVGPFGAGYGRVGVFGAAVGAAALLAPAAGPGALGLLAAIPGLSFAGAAAIGSLVLAFGGLGKALEGDKKAFDDLSPSAQKFVLTLRGMHGWLDKLKQTAAGGLFPGLTAGIHSALSPGTRGVITHGVGETSRALGAGAAQWGKYFGSTQFQALLGPLVTAGAKNIRTLSDALLHLFDAFAVLGRAAIPFTNWLLVAIDRGSKFASTWMRAKDASGSLGRGMNEAKVSLRLVAGLFLALGRVVVALGRALYPVSKLIAKDLTAGLNWLAGVINRNRAGIREFATMLVHVLAGAVRAVVSGIDTLLRGFRMIVGHKGAVIAAVAAIGVALALALGPYGAVIVGVLLAIGLIRRHWRTLGVFFHTLTAEIKNAFKWLWVQIERSAIKAALFILKAFDFKILGRRVIPGVHGLVRSMQAELSRLHAPNMNWSRQAALQGARAGLAWGHNFTAAVNDAIDKKRKHGGVVLRRGGRYIPPPEADKPTPKPPPKPGTHAWYMKYLGYDPTDEAGGSPYGEADPFTKNVPKAPKAAVVPSQAAHLEALASREASMAANARTAAGRRKHLERELKDLERADRLLHEKLRRVKGKDRTRIENEITKVENAERRAHAQLRKQVEAERKKASTDREAALKLAVDRAKLAVANAKVGTHAYEQAVKAEERALSAEIAYYDKRAHNAKLSAAARDKALKAELALKKQLADLEKKAKKKGPASGADEAQFLSSFKSIIGNFGPNATPLPPQERGSKSETHLHDLVHESRRGNHYLRELVAKDAFPHSGRAVDAAGAVTG